jgi:hypothetical protein
MPTLNWQARGRGLGLYADGADHRFYVYKMHGRRPWVVKVSRLETVAGIRVPRPTGALYDENNESQKLAKAIAQAFEDDVDAAEKPSQNRLTRAVGHAYRVTP